LFDCADYIASLFMIPKGFYTEEFNIIVSWTQESGLLFGDS